VETEKRIGNFRVNRKVDWGIIYLGPTQRGVTPAGQVTVRILVAGDDRHLLATLTRALRAEGYEVETVEEGTQALRAAAAHRPDLVVLDVMIPGLDAVAVCRRLRTDHAVPVLMLTALGATPDRVRGLDGGADDYLVKPFDRLDLLARVRALLKRVPPAGRLQFLDVGLEPAAREAWRGDRRLGLTATEFRLLDTFLRHPGQVLSRERLLEAVWEREVDSDNVVAVYVGYLRRKLEAAGEPRVLHTSRGAGYVLREPAG